MPPVPQFSPASSIDDVLQRLDAIIAQATIERDRLGFFAVLYRTVTTAIKHGISAGRFEDGRRMERLDVVFANRYLAAFDAHRNGGRPRTRGASHLPRAPAGAPSSCNTCCSV
jgi:hypothetical protein